MPNGEIDHVEANFFSNLNIKMKQREKCLKMYQLKWSYLMFRIIFVIFKLIPNFLLEPKKFNYKKIRKIFKFEAQICLHAARFNSLHLRLRLCLASLFVFHRRLQSWKLGYKQRKRSWKWVIGMCQDLWAGGSILKKKCREFALD